MQRQIAWIAANSTQHMIARKIGSLYVTAIEGRCDVRTDSYRQCHVSQKRSIPAGELHLTMRVECADDCLFLV